LCIVISPTNAGLICVARQKIRNCYTGPRSLYDNITFGTVISDTILVQIGYSEVETMLAGCSLLAVPISTTASFIDWCT